MSEQAKSESHAPTASHTPGPWRILTQVNSVRIICGDRLAPIMKPSRAYVAHLGRSHVDEANARLIAAAPDMLAALKEACRKVHSFDPAGDQVLKQIRAAIAKAESQS